MPRPFARLRLVAFTLTTEILLHPAAARRKHPHYYKTQIVNGTKRDCLCGACDNTSFAHYRLADTFKGVKPPQLARYACFWPESLACAYARTHAGRRDLPALLAAVDALEAARPAERIPGAAAWHLRLGDVAQDFDSKGGPYVYGRAYFEAVVARLPEDVRRVTLVYSTTHAPCVGTAPADAGARSERYARDAAAFLEGRNFAVAVRRDRDPDDDLRFMATADALVLGGGGFSLLAARVAFASRDPAPLVYGVAAARQVADAGAPEQAGVGGDPRVVDVFAEAP